MSAPDLEKEEEAKYRAWLEGYAKRVYAKGFKAGQERMRQEAIRAIADLVDRYEPYVSGQLHDAREAVRVLQIEALLSADEHEGRS